MGEGNLLNRHDVVMTIRRQRQLGAAQLVARSVGVAWLATRFTAASQRHSGVFITTPWPVAAGDQPISYVTFDWGQLTYPRHRWRIRWTGSRSAMGVNRGVGIRLFPTTRAEFFPIWLRHPHRTINYRRVGRLDLRICSTVTTTTGVELDWPRGNLCLRTSRRSHTASSG